MLSGVDNGTHSFNLLAEREPRELDKHNTGHGKLLCDSQSTEVDILCDEHTIGRMGGL
jgi:hypothetical protein